MSSIQHSIQTTNVSCPWTKGLVEGINRSLQDYLRCITTENDTNYTEWLSDVKFSEIHKYQQP